MDRQKVAKEAITHYNKVHANLSLEAKNFYIAGWLDGLEEFVSLVKQMRECQRKIARFVSAVDPISYDEYEASQDVIKLESEVDEWLEKLN